MRALQRLVPACGAALLALAGPASPAHAQWNYIIGGEPAPELESVGAFLHNGDWFCTGTVVAPRVVLTAAHCLSDLKSPEGIQFFLGADANHVDQGRTIDVTELHVHPDYGSTDNADIAVAILGEDAGVDAVAVNTQTLGEDAIGRNITLVGYGFVIQDQEGGEKRKVEIPISGVSDFFIDYETPGKNTCQGDSGGPAMVWDPDGTAYVLGVTSYGDAECAVDGHNTRSDVFADFVGAFLDGQWQGDPEVTDPGQIPIEPGTDPDDGEGGDVDFCAEFEWYDDGVCDDCPQPDPDCEDGEDPGEDPGETEGDEGDDSGCSGGAPDMAVTGFALALLAGVMVAARRRSRRLGSF